MRIYLQVAKKVKTPQEREDILRRALEMLPTSFRLWLAAIELAGKDDARVLLQQATACCPMVCESLKVIIAGHCST